MEYRKSTIAFQRFLFYFTLFFVWFLFLNLFVFLFTFLIRHVVSLASVHTAKQWQIFEFDSSLTCSDRYCLLNVKYNWFCLILFICIFVVLCLCMRSQCEYIETVYLYSIYFLSVFYLNSLKSVFCFCFPLFVGIALFFVFCFFPFCWYSPIGLDWENWSIQPVRLSVINYVHCIGFICWRAISSIACHWTMNLMSTFSWWNVWKG